MEIPIYENDTQIGTLKVSSQGLYTVFAAKLPLLLPAGTDKVDRSGRRIAAPAAAGERNDAGRGLTRLWLVGRDGDCADLGLLQPGKEGRTLCRRFSRMECRRLPAKPMKSLALPSGEKPKLPGRRENGRQKNAPTGEKTDSELRIPNSEYSWRRLPDGSLIDPGRRLLALPWAGGKLPPGVRKILVKGREYWAFRY